MQSRRTGNRNPSASLRLTLGNVTDNNGQYQYPPQYKGDASEYSVQLNCPHDCECGYSQTEPTPSTTWTTFRSTPISAQGNSLWIRVKYNAGVYACTPTNLGGGYISQVVPNVVPSQGQQPGLGIFIPELPNSGNVCQTGSSWTVAPGSSGLGTCTP